MKFSISVPDDLWRQVARDSAQGPSDIVQQALRTLAAQQRRATGPMANAPDPAQHDRYRPAFDEAVAKVAGAIREVQDSGYRFGMLLASGLAMTDFDVLDQVAAASQIKQIVESPVRAGAHIERSEDLLSDSLYDRCFELLEVRAAAGSGPSTQTAHELEAMFGSPDGPAPGVRWIEAEEGERPVISNTFAKSVVAALRDVRDESLRCIRGQQDDQAAG